MKDKFKPLDDNGEHKDTVLSLFSSMFKVGELVSLARGAFLNKGFEDLNNTLTSSGKGRLPNLKTPSSWVDSGVICEILKPGAKGWQTGKFRIKVTLEFCPDEPEIPETPASKEPEISQPQSPLDDIRRIINQESQQ